jgi:DNA-binding CsgD family transcriptional regulator
MKEIKVIALLVSKNPGVWLDELQKCSFKVIHVPTCEEALKEIVGKDKFILFFEQSDKIKFFNIEPLHKIENFEEMIGAMEKIKGGNKSKIRFALEGLGYSVKQAEILEQLSMGECNKKIADIVHLSEQGVKYHVGILLKDFEVDNRKDLQKRLQALVSEGAEINV